MYEIIKRSSISQDGNGGYTRDIVATCETEEEARTLYEEKYRNLENGWVSFYIRESK